MNPYYSPYYSPYIYKKKQKGLSLFSFFYYILIIIVIAIIIYYASHYYRVYTKTVNLQNNNQNTNSQNNNLLINNQNTNNNHIESKEESSEDNLIQMEFTENLCRSLTSNSFIDDNTPEDAGVECLINYIKTFGQEVEDNIYELNYSNSIHKKYRLNLNTRYIYFYDENGIKRDHIYCIFKDTDNKGCVVVPNN